MATKVASDTTATAVTTRTTETVVATEVARQSSRTLATAATVASKLATMVVRVALSRSHATMTTIKVDLKVVASRPGTTKRTTTSAMAVATVVLPTTQRCLQKREARTRSRDKATVVEVDLKLASPSSAEALLKNERTSH